ncbi:type 4b pilus protein PilO2 [Serratia symbiotica]|uniref:type 4b pilus protein PilO2 n=1 Tax=Serratia symbiotica TaxID=138074 RepID=UPI001328102F|nr:type 4b pilus protein PilO2 [Serratia symbiotica]QTP13353.1 type 4b pilus protein PilO2 [Serratia symbiotica]
MIKELIGSFSEKINKFVGLKTNKVKVNPTKIELNQKIDIININGVDYVTGLVWNTISNPRGIMSEARRFGRENSMDVVAIRESLMKAQAGYVGRNKGVNKEMYSLASTLAGLLEKEHMNDTELQQRLEQSEEPDNDLQSEGVVWLGVFEVDPAMLRRSDKKKKDKNRSKKEFQEDNLIIDLSRDENNTFALDEDEILLGSPEQEKLYYILAVVEGNVVPQSDKLGTRDEIERLFSRINSLYGSTKKIHRYYFPISWGRGSESIDLIDFLQQGKLSKQYKLKQLTLGMTKREWGIAAVILIAGAGYIVYERYQAHLADIEFQRLQQEENARIALQRQRIREATGTDVKANDLIRPWVSKPSVSEFTSVCHKRMSEIPPYLGGWQLIKIDCQEKNIKLDYVREIYSTIDDFRRAAKKVFGVEADIPGEASGNRGYVVLTNSMKPGGNEEPENLSDLMSSVASQFQQVEAEYSFKKAEAETLPKLPGQTEAQEKVMPAPWTTMSFQVKSDYEPEVIFKGSKQKVLRIDSIITNITEEKYTWTTIGKIYAKAQIN